MVDVTVKGKTAEPGDRLSAEKRTPTKASRTTSGKDKVGAGDVGTTKQSFSESIGSARRTLIDGSLRDVLAIVRARGERFLRSPEEKLLEEYKDGITQFLERARKELFALKEELGSEKDGQRKVFQLVETIDRDVDMLTRETLQKDKPLLLLASLDDIRGLIVDLVK
ncbi:MAG: DUF327 family protein [Candidatus Riflebacteria bacterium]|nr:DUF327 family protein [Candidatus Riflebacteria bacterium]